jgi:hypothetical protein
MAVLVAIIGAAVALLGLVGVASPEAMRRFGSRFRDPPALYAAAAIRMAIGALLFLAGPACRPETPWIGTAVRIFGALLVLAAGVLLIIGPARFRAIIDWSLNQSPAFLRGWSLFAVVIGGLLIYAGS